MTDTDTRHSHGTMRHDHEGGELPHNHKLGDPKLSGPAPAPNPCSGGAFLTSGIMLMVFGGLGMLWKSGNHTACGSVLVQAVKPRSQCAEANLIWTGGIVALVIGAVLLIVGAIHAHEVTSLALGALPASSRRRRGWPGRQGRTAGRRTMAEGGG